MNDRFTRIKWLVGEEKFQKISQTKVLVCGLGGVGGICVDALYRSGFQNLTLIDADKFEITNQNRQIHSENLGEEKAKVFARIYNVKGIVSKIDNEFLANFDLSEFDLIIDAIDDIPAKVALANLIDFKRQIFISSTGGARKLDPTRIKTTSIFKTHGDALQKNFVTSLENQVLKEILMWFFQMRKRIVKILDLSWV